MRVFICGQKAFGAAIFELCRRRGDDILGVSAPLCASDGKSPDRLRRAASLSGVPVSLAGALRADTLPGGVDVILAAHSYDFIGEKTRRGTRLGAIGYHPSLLPVHRGRDAVRWTIRMRDRITGGTVFWLDNGVDTGDIAAQRHVFVAPRETAETLWRDKLFPLGVLLFSEVLRDLDAGIIRSIPQDNACATHEPKITGARLYRPELPQIGPPPEGFTVIRDDSLDRVAGIS